MYWKLIPIVSTVIEHICLILLIVRLFVINTGASCNLVHTSLMFNSLTSSILIHKIKQVAILGILGISLEICADW